MYSIQNTFLLLHMKFQKNLRQGARHTARDMNNSQRMRAAKNPGMNNSQHMRAATNPDIEIFHHDDPDKVVEEVDEKNEAEIMGFLWEKGAITHILEIVSEYAKKIKEKYNVVLKGGYAHEIQFSRQQPTGDIDFQVYEKVRGSHGFFPDDIYENTISAMYEIASVIHDCVVRESQEFELKFPYFSIVEDANDFILFVPGRRGQPYAGVLPHTPFGADDNPIYKVKTRSGKWTSVRENHTIPFFELFRVAMLFRDKGGRRFKFNVIDVSHAIRRFEACDLRPPKQNNYLPRNILCESLDEIVFRNILVTIKFQENSDTDPSKINRKINRIKEVVEEAPSELSTDIYKIAVDFLDHKEVYIKSSFLQCIDDFWIWRDEITQRQGASQGNQYIRVQLKPGLGFGGASGASGTALKLLVPGVLAILVSVAASCIRLA